MVFALFKEILNNLGGWPHGHWYKQKRESNTIAALPRLARSRLLDTVPGLEISEHLRVKHSRRGVLEFLLLLLNLRQIGRFLLFQIVDLELQRVDSLLDSLS